VCDGACVTSYRILVVDDYPSTAAITCTLLGILGHETCAACTGREALDRAAEFSPDIAILDIGLPDISGYDVARELRNVFAGRPLYIAAITGWGQPHDRARAYAAGFDQHLLKPVDATKLRELLRRAEEARA
jgi:CheY-like chemotaxis protein